MNKYSNYIWASITLFLLIVSWVLYTHREQRDSNTYSINMFNTAKMNMLSDEIFDNTKAGVLVLWAADVKINTRTVLLVKHDKKDVKELIGYTDNIFSSNTMTNILISRLMTDGFTCGQFNTASKIGMFVAGVGASNICRKGIMHNGQLIGYISLSYATPPDDAEAARIDKYLDGIVAQIVEPKK